MPNRFATRSFLFLLCSMVWTVSIQAEDVIDIWPELAPGETSRELGEALPARENENPPVTRIRNVTRPTMTVYQPDQPNGSAVIILPGGGFRIVVPDKEGSEAAEWLKPHGVTSFVLNYRTTDDPSAPGWKPALQDAQRAIAFVRRNSEKWGLKKDRIGMVAFSAGGQVGARLLCDQGQLAYESIDDVDKTSHRPDFAILVYPWRLYDEASDALISDVVVPSDAPPTFLVHTHDDRSSSLGAVLFYAGLKKHGIPAELHVYGNGGHGYGIRPVDGSQISSWTDHAAHWLGTVGMK